MLGNLGFGGRVDDAELGANDDVGNGRVGSRVAEAQPGQAIAIDDVLDVKGRPASIQVFDGSGDRGRILQKDQSNIVGCHGRNVHTSHGGDEIGVDFLEQSGIDGSLAMLGRDDDQRLFVDPPGFKSGNDPPEGSINKVECLQEFGSECQGPIDIAAGFLADGNGLEIAAEKNRRLRQTGSLDFGIDRGCSDNPLQEGIDVKLIKGNGSFDGVGKGGDFGEIASGQAVAGRTSNEVVCWMLIGVGGLTAT